MNGTNVCGRIFGLYVAACPGAGGIGLCRIGFLVGLRSLSPRTGEGGLGHVGWLIGLSLGIGGVGLSPLLSDGKSGTVVTAFSGWAS